MAGVEFSGSAVNFGSAVFSGGTADLIRRPGPAGAAGRPMARLLVGVPGNLE